MLQVFFLEDNHLTMESMHTTEQNTPGENMIWIFLLHDVSISPKIWQRRGNKNSKIQ